MFYVRWLSRLTCPVTWKVGIELSFLEQAVVGTEMTSEGLENVETCEDQGGELGWKGVKDRAWLERELIQGAQVQFSALISGGSQPPVIPVPGMGGSDIFGFSERQIHVHIITPQVLQLKKK